MYGCLVVPPGYRAIAEARVSKHSRHAGRSRASRLPRAHARERGQSLVEFPLVIPILLILFVGIADFGRVFNAGVVLEASTRDAAEHAAQLYLAAPPGDPAQTPTVRLSAAVPSPD